MSCDRIDDLETLRCEAAALAAKAEAATRHYDRTTWIRFTIVFFPVPLIVVIMRLQVDAWAYYIYGAAIVVLGMAMYALDSAARDRRDAAIRVAEEARQQCDGALATSFPPHPAAAG